MATWIFILHMLVPLNRGLTATLTTDAPVVDDSEDDLRYRGLERMFAKFESED